MAGQITFEVTLNTDDLEFEIKVKGNPTWTHTTHWTCEVVPATFDLKVYKELDTIMKLQNTFDDSLHVTLTSIRNRKQCLIFAFRHDTLDDAVEMATKYVDVKETISNFIQEIDAKVTDISLRCSVGEQNESSEQDNRNTESKPVLFSAPVDSKDYKAETDWFCNLHDPNMDMTPFSRILSRLKTKMESSFSCTVHQIRHGSLKIECKHETRKDGLEMVKNIVKVKDAIFEFLHEINPHVNAITVHVEYRETEEQHVERSTPTPERRESREDRALRVASTKGDLAEVKRILAAGLADINSRGQYSRTPVMKAAWGRHKDMVELLVKEGADVSLVDNDGDNLLHLACCGGDVETVNFVLSLNALDVDARNNNGQTAADRARQWGKQGVVDLMMFRDAQ